MEMEVEVEGKSESVSNAQRRGEEVLLRPC